jgi:hypothetical protein
MDPTDHLRALLDGVTCTVCEDRVPADQVRILAWRDDLAFLEITCRACQSTTLGFVMAGGSASERTSNPDAEPISSDDVLDMHQFLARWEGDLAAALENGDSKISRGLDPRP